ncbi:MAG: VWA domain-containing protein [Pyrinomonadaceae bacterium]
MKLLFAVILSLVFRAAVAQTPVDDNDVVRVDTDVTNLLFTAANKQKQFINNLREDEIRVFEDGVPQQLLTFQKETDRPLSIAFLIDVSGSEEKTLPKEKAAARAFIETAVQSSKDEVAIIPFTHAAFLEQNLTNNVLNVFRSLQSVDIALPGYLGSGKPLTGITSGPGTLRPPEEGSTAIWEAIALTSDNVLSRTSSTRRRAIILLTDGQDTSSRLPRNVAIEQALQNEVTIYGIGIGDDDPGIDRNALRAVSELTGGRAFFPKKDADLKAAFAEIELELRSQYLLAYSSTNKRRDGSYRQVKIEITNAERSKEQLQLRYRPGYFANPLVKR